MLEYLRLTGWTDEVLVPLPSHDNDDHRLLLFRKGGPRFSEREIDVLTLIRTHVAELHTNQLRKQATAVALTPRQVEILRLVAAGSTNRQIARTLAISEGTARTHLANIYTKLVRPTGHRHWLRPDSSPDKTKVRTTAVTTSRPPSGTRPKDDPTRRVRAPLR